MMSATVKQSKKWAEESYDTYTRQFGPLKATVHSHRVTWGSDVTEYRAFLSIGSEVFSVTVAELGVEWFDDNIAQLACKALEKKIKAHIRSWL